jgi:phosphatidylglycerophosphate synthase
MAFWDAYRASLKPAEVEEPIDRVLHRPLAYILAKLCAPTPISPDAITIGSMIIGASGALCIGLNFPWHQQIGGLLVFGSILFDCADGQLARMRGTSSAFGRMIDGVADLFVASCVAPATMLVLWRRWHDPLWLGITVLALAVVTIVTSSFHTSTYDHYKNVWLRFTTPSYKEGEDYAAALARYQTLRDLSLAHAISWQIYLFYVKGQEDYIRGFDPFTSPALGQLPPYSPENEAIYRRHVAAPWATMRTFLGFGSLMFGLSVSNILEIPDAFLLFRLLVLNSLFFFYVRPRQRAASRAALAEMAAAQPAP